MLKTGRIAGNPKVVNLGQSAAELQGRLKKVQRLGTLR
jgi:hypothetical protein